MKPFPFEQDSDIMRKPISPGYFIFKSWRCSDQGARTIRSARTQKEGHMHHPHSRGGRGCIPEGVTSKPLFAVRLWHTKEGCAECKSFYTMKIHALLDTSALYALCLGQCYSAGNIFDNCTMPKMGFLSLPWLRVHQS